MKTHNLDLAKEILQSNESAAFLTSGASMRPLLRTHKDIVIISRANHPLSIGEVPLYSKKGVSKLILHRIIDIAPDGRYIILGDNTYRKEYVPQEDVVGVMTAIYRGGKYIDCKNSKAYKFMQSLGFVKYSIAESSIRQWINTKRLRNSLIYKKIFLQKS